MSGNALVFPLKIQAICLRKMPTIVNELFDKCLSLTYTSCTIIYNNKENRTSRLCLYAHAH